MTVLGLDIGTSAVKGLLLDEDGRVMTAHRRSYRLHLPGPGRVELPPEQVWRAASAVIARLALSAREAGSPVRAVAASASGDEVAMVDAEGVAVGPVILALDTRSRAIGRAVEQRFGAEQLYRRTGIALTGLAPVVRLLWLREEQPAIAARVDRLLAWPEYLALRLGVEPCSEPSLAGRTLGFDLHTGRYAADLLAVLEVDIAMLPTVVPSGTAIGTVSAIAARELGLGPDVALVTGGFDQAMATLGAGVCETGLAHVGTGSYEALSALVERPLIDAGLRASGWSVGRSVAGSARWSAMASWLGGAALDRLAANSTETSPGGRRPSVKRLLREVPDGPARTLALASLEAGSGAVVGMDLGTRRGDIAAALMEAVTMDLRRALAHLDRAGVPVRSLRATGGGADPRWLQLKADVTGRVVERPLVREAGAFAAGLMAGAAIGELPPIAEAVRDMVHVDMRVEPRRALEAHYEERAALHAELRDILDAWRGVGT